MSANERVLGQIPVPGMGYGWNFSRLLKKENGGKNGNR
jgi:hypothetical protein